MLEIKIERVERNFSISKNCFLLNCVLDFTYRSVEFNINLIQILRVVKICRLVRYKFLKLFRRHERRRKDE